MSLMVELEKKISSLQQKLNEETQKTIKLQNENIILQTYEIENRKLRQQFGENFEGIREIFQSQLEKMKLEQQLQFMKNQISAYQQEIHEQTNALRNYESELENIIQQCNILQEEVAQITSQNQKIEEQMRNTNQNFVVVQQQLTNFQRENKELNEQIETIEKEKQSISLKWQKASAQTQTDDRTQAQLKQIQQLYVSKNQQLEEFKSRFVAANTELKIFKDSESSFKELLDQKIRDFNARIANDQQEQQNMLQYTAQLQKQIQNLEMLLKRQVESASKSMIEAEELEISKINRCSNKDFLQLSNKHEDLLKQKDQISEEKAVIETRLILMSQENEQLQNAILDLERKLEKSSFLSVFEVRDEQVAHHQFPDYSLTQSKEYENFVNILNEQKFQNSLTQFQKFLVQKFDDFVKRAEQTDEIRSQYRQMEIMYNRLMVKYFQQQKKIKSLESNQAQNLNSTSKVPNSNQTFTSSCSVTQSSDFQVNAIVNSSRLSMHTQDINQNLSANSKMGNDHSQFYNTDLPKQINSNNNVNSNMNNTSARESNESPILRRGSSYQNSSNASNNQSFSMYQSLKQEIETLPHKDMNTTYDLSLSNPILKQLLKGEQGWNFENNVSKLDMVSNNKNNSEAASRNRSNQNQGRHNRINSFSGAPSTYANNEVNKQVNNSVLFNKLNARTQNNSKTNLNNSNAPLDQYATSNSNNVNNAFNHLNSNNQRSSVQQN